MYFSDIIRRSGRSLRSAKARTILTALAIGVGGFTLTLTLAAGNGANEYAQRLVRSNFDPAELIVGRDKEISNDGAPSSKPQEYDESIGTMSGGPNATFQVKRISRDDVEKLRANPLIEQVRENYQIVMRYITREGQKKYTGSIEAYNPAQKPELVTGELPKTGDIATGSALLPEAYIESLGFSSAQEAVGKTVSVVVRKPFSAESLQQLLQTTSSQNLITTAQTVKPEEMTASFKVAGITKKPATNLGFGVLPVSVSTEDARKLYDFTVKGTPDYQQYLFVYARVKNGDDPAMLEAAQSSLVAQGFEVQSIKDIQKTINQFISVLQYIVLVFGLITLIASVFGVINTQYISVLERTREIGLMKALGMRRLVVSNLFILEATWIGFMGGVIGALSAIALGTLLNPWLTDVLDLGNGNRILIFNPTQIVVLILALMFIATVAGLLPALKAARLDPIEALRTE